MANTTSRLRLGWKTVGEWTEKELKSHTETYEKSTEGLGLRVVGCQNRGQTKAESRVETVITSRRQE